MLIMQQPNNAFERGLACAERRLAYLEHKSRRVPLAGLALGSAQLISSLAGFIIASVALVLTLGCSKTVLRSWAFFGAHAGLGVRNVLLTLCCGAIISFPLGFCKSIKTQLTAQIKQNYETNVYNLSTSLKQLRDLDKLFKTNGINLGIQSDIEKIEKIVDLYNDCANAAFNGNPIPESLWDELYEFLIYNKELGNPKTENLSIQDRLEQSLLHFQEHCIGQITRATKDNRCIEQIKKASANPTIDLDQLGKDLQVLQSFHTEIYNLLTEETKPLSEDAKQPLSDETKHRLEIYSPLLAVLLNRTFIKVLLEKCSDVPVDRKESPNGDLVPSNPLRLALDFLKTLKTQLKESGDIRFARLDGLLVYLEKGEAPSSV